MNFDAFASALHAHVAAMTKDAPALFVTDATGDELWAAYLAAFPEGTNPKYRERGEHDCSACRHFIKSFGNVVALKDGKVVTIWDFDAPEEGGYAVVVKKMSETLRQSHRVSDVFISGESTFGIKANREQLEDGTVVTWQHLHADIPARLVSRSADTIETQRAAFRDLRAVFARSLSEITADAVATVLELITAKSLYKGEENEGLLRSFGLELAKYGQLQADSQENYLWERCITVGGALGKIRNHAIGTLLTDVSTGVELDEAVRKYEAMVAPANYKRPKAIYTKAMLEKAKADLEAEGLLPSLPRRFARLDDISAADVLFANRDARQRMTQDTATTAFSALEKASLTVNPKAFERTEEISIDDFLSGVLPTVTSIDALFESRHRGNLVSLIAPENAEAKPLFKWGNNFSWAYAGNVTDAMKERVKALGGKVDGVLRFSIQWNDDGDNPNDFDAHCVEPGGNHIYFGTKKGRALHASSGELDVDIVVPRAQTGSGVAVENITWSNRAKMPEGRYQFFVHCYNNRGGRKGFTAEIEADGQLYSFAYGAALRTDEKVAVADVEYTRREGFKIIERLPAQSSSVTLWGVNTQQFVPVSVVSRSPNAWGNLAEPIAGNRHVFFFLQGCQNPEKPNGFFNEYLPEELSKHRRVLEALGSTLRVADTEDQLSGLGFCSTLRNSLVVRTEGRVSRTLKILF